MIRQTQSPILRFMLLVFCFPALPAMSAAQIPKPPLENNIHQVLQLADHGTTPEPEPQILTFENQVPPQPLAQVSNLPSGPALQLDFVTSAPGSQQIRMPEQGSFALTVEAGPGFNIIDNEATDGTAKVVLPSQAYDIYVRADSKSTSGLVTPGSLILEDSLYYVKHLASPSEQKWSVMLGRPLPTPEGWHSPDGGHYTLKLTNTGLQNLTSIWRPAEQVNFPPGLKEIGPEGGVIELTGIARLEVPQGAISQKTMISVRQELFLKEIITQTRHRNNTSTMMFVSPVVKIEPINLKLNLPGRLFLKFLPKYEGIFPPTVIWSYSFDLTTWLSGDYAYYPEKLSGWNSDIPGEVKELGYYAKQVISTKSSSRN